MDDHPEYTRMPTGTMTTAEQLAKLDDNKPSILFWTKKQQTLFLYMEKYQKFINIIKYD